MATIEFFVKEKLVSGWVDLNLVPQEEEDGRVKFKLAGDGMEVMICVPKEDWMAFAKAMPKERSFVSREGMEWSLDSIQKTYQEQQDKMIEHIKNGDLYYLSGDLSKIHETRGKIAILRLLLGELDKEEGIKPQS